MNSLYLLVFAVILVSGCVGFEGFDFDFGFQPTKPETVEASPDVIVVQNLNVIPSQVYASASKNAPSTFTVSFEVKHQGDPKESKDAENVKVDFYNWGVCEPQPKSEFNKKEINGKVTKVTKEFGKLFPQQTEFIELEFKAPTNDEIANMRATCPIMFKVNYDFEAVSQVDINVISGQRIKELQRAGELVTVTPKQTIGIGPVKIYFEFSHPQPFRTGSNVLMLITVEDKGTGLLKGNKIESGNLKLKIPEDFKVECDNFESNGEYKLNKDIDMVRKKSPQIRCTLTMPAVSQSKTYYITASLEYSYSLDNKIDVPIIPTVT